MDVTAKPTSHRRPAVSLPAAFRSVRKGSGVLRRDTAQSERDSEVSVLILQAAISASLFEPSGLSLKICQISMSPAPLMKIVPRGSQTK